MPPQLAVGQPTPIDAWAWVTDWFSVPYLNYHRMCRRLSWAAAFLLHRLNCCPAPWATIWIGVALKSLQSRQSRFWADPKTSRLYWLIRWWSSVPTEWVGGHSTRYLGHLCHRLIHRLIQWLDLLRAGWSGDHCLGPAAILLLVTDWFSDHTWSPPYELVDCVGGNSHQDSLPVFACFCPGFITIIWES